MSIKIGSGIFCWLGYERASGRYGFFGMSPTNFHQTVRVQPTWEDVWEAFVGKRVRVFCKVVEARQSGHDGDRHLKISPSTPKRGEQIELGVGIFTHTYSFGELQWGLTPNDGRTVNWMDPNTLYRLHDQTVEVYAEETKANFSPAPRIPSVPNGALVMENGDYQIRHTGLAPGGGVKLKPKFTRLGEGLFSMSNDYEPGELVEVELA